MHHLYCSVRQKRYLLLKGTLVLGQQTAQAVVLSSLLILSAILIRILLGSLAPLTVARVRVHRYRFGRYRVALLKPVVSLLKERHVVVQLLKIKLSVDIDLTVVGNGVAKRCSVLKIGSSNPVVGGIVRRV